MSRTMDFKYSMFMGKMLSDMSKDELIEVIEYMEQESANKVKQDAKDKEAFESLKKNKPKFDLDPPMASIVFLIIIFILSAL